MNYIVYFRLKLKHTYYPGEVCRDIRIVPARSTLDWLNRQQLLYRAYDDEWVLLGPEGFQFDKEAGLTLGLFIKRPEMLLYTELDKTTQGHTFILRLTGTESRIDIPADIKETETQKTIRETGRIFYPLANLTGASGAPDELVVYFHAPALKWEYFFIPRNGNSDRNILLEETGKQIAFTSVEKVEFMHAAAWRVRSDAPIVLKEKYPYRLRLTEETPFGKKVLMSRVPWPQPGQFQGTAPGYIRQVVYF